MLDGRLHRLSLAFVMLPLIAIAAFSLKPSPIARTVALAPDAFDQGAAIADLKHLQAIPNRTPGSIGDDQRIPPVSDGDGNSNGLFAADDCVRRRSCDTRQRRGTA